MAPFVLLLLGLGGAVALSALPPWPQARLRALRVGTPARESAPRVANRVWAAVRVHWSTAPGRDSAAWRAAVVELCGALASELRAGRPAGEALAIALSELPGSLSTGCAPVIAAARAGDDPVPPLRALAAHHGCTPLAYVAGCWQVAADTGSSLADVMERLARGLAAEEARRRELAAQLAGPRTTAILLSVLPAAGLAMSAGMGGRPLAFLFGSPAGLACFTAGAALDALGLWWTRRLTRSALAAQEAG